MSQHHIATDDNSELPCPKCQNKTHEVFYGATNTRWKKIRCMNCEVILTAHPADIYYYIEEE